MVLTNKNIYFDYAATTPLDSEVEEALLPYLKENFGNPNSLHSFGQEAISAMDDSRELIAKELGADFSEIIFTGSATEADNLALRGVIKNTQIENPKIIISSIEHPAVKKTAWNLKSQGVDLVEISVDKKGFINLDELKSALDKNTVLVSIMYANNEIGTIEPIKKIIKIIDDFKKSHDNSIYPLLHTDAVQAFQYFDCDTADFGVDMMTLSAHKIYGPKGIGLLYVKKDENDNYPISPIITGGTQEFNIRSGTENVASVVGFSKAIELASQKREEERERMIKIGEYFLKKIKEIYPKLEINGIENKKNKVLPNIYNIYLPDYKAEELLIKFDMAGVAVSAGSACSARSADPSHVIKSLFNSKRAEKSIRFSFGRNTSKKEINEALSRIEKIFKKD